MGELRADWQKFKKANPAFTSAQVAKADLGPHLDSFQKSFAAMNKSLIQAQALAEKCKADIDRCLKAIEVYDVLVKKMPPNDKKKYTQAVEEIKLRLGRLGQATYLATEQLMTIGNKSLGAIDASLKK